MQICSTLPTKLSWQVASKVASFQMGSCEVKEEKEKETHTWSLLDFESFEIFNKMCKVFISEWVAVLIQYSSSYTIFFK